MLEANWTGASTVPSRRQYPHQWGWDAASSRSAGRGCDPARAARELESLLRGQWADGRVPHIVFHPAVAEDAYFPGPAFWRSDARRRAGGVATSGLIQPPLHARAALEVGARARRRDAARAFLRRVFPRLAAQHDYLAGRRDAGGAGLAAIVHPWESGLDDSPAWDAPLAAVALPPGGVAPYERRDLEHVDPRERPDDAAYDRFVQLARTYRDGGYADDGRERPFVVEDPLFNAIWLWSTHAMAEIAALPGADPGAAPRGGARPSTRAARAAVGPASAASCRATCATGRLLEPPHGAVARARCSTPTCPRRAPGAGRRARPRRTSAARRPRRGVVRPARPGLRPPPLLARAGVGQPELAARPRPARARADRAGRRAGGHDARARRAAPGCASTSTR